MTARPLRWRRRGTRLARWAAWACAAALVIAASAGSLPNALAPGRLAAHFRHAQPAPAPRHTVGPAGVAPATAIGAVLVASGLHQPTDIAHTGLLTDTRLFVVERHGRIRIIDNGALLPDPYLDISSLVNASGYEEGMLGLAFHPDFAARRQFFVYYTDNAGNLQLSRFSAAGVDDNVAQPAATSILNIPHPDFPNHNGGSLRFGPDGYLYVGVGDGGGGGDPHQHGQYLGTLLGKILRLDVTGQATYVIPAGNPLTPAQDVRGEIWAYGLRNPWRISFDRLTGDLYIADVGQTQREEVNFQPHTSAGGENYGWRCYEGFQAYDLNGCGPAGNYVFPVIDYGHSEGQSITGGYVYRGAAYPNMQGLYFYADFNTSRFWAMRPGIWSPIPLAGVSVPSPSSFGEDVHGEVFVASFSGSIYHMQFLERSLFLPLVVR